MAFRIILAAILILGLGASRTLADMTPAEIEKLPRCVTSLGTDGYLYNNLDGFVESPVDYEYAWASRKDVGIGRRDGASLRSLAGGQARLVMAHTPTVITFVRSDRTVSYQCAVEVIRFDGAHDSLAKLTVGNCNFALIDGPQTPMLGEVQTFLMPEGMSGVGTSTDKVFGTALLPEQKFQVYGVSIGIQTLRWFRDTSHGDQLNICPFSVASAKTYPAGKIFKDSEMCNDTSNIPMRLHVGQTAVMFAWRTGSPRDYSLGPAIPGIVDTRPLDPDKTKFEIKAQAIGVTSVIIGGGLSEAQKCMIVVE